MPTSSPVPVAVELPALGQLALAAMKATGQLTLAVELAMEPTAFGQLAQEAREEARELAREVALATASMKMTASQVTATDAPPVPERLPATQAPLVLAAMLISGSEPPEQSSSN